MLPEDFSVDCSIGVVSKEKFAAFQEAHPDLKPRLYHRSDGMLFCYGLPRLVHEELAAWVLRKITAALIRRGISENFFSDPSSPTCIIGDARKEPDMTFRSRPRDLATKAMYAEGNPFPTLIVESSFTHESLDELKDFLDLWLSEDTDVQMAIGTRLFPCGRLEKEGSLFYPVRGRIQAFKDGTTERTDV